MSRRMKTAGLARGLSEISQRSVGWFFGMSKNSTRAALSAAGAELRLVARTKAETEDENPRIADVAVRDE